MRTAAFILIALQTAIVAIVIYGAATSRSDAAGNAMAEAYAIIAAAVFIVFALPALIVALVTRQEWLALTLSLIGAVGFGALMAVL
ncbi:MAG: hypothetical protein GEU91_06390 [Rhizobiales bacterium]|nr:hypothetical protein [Hyphomicrobiales bacterium]